MRACVERGQFPFDDRQGPTARGPLLLPSEMNCYAGLLATWAHPELVRGNGADFSNHQVWRDLIAQAFNGEDRLDCVLARNEIFGLKLLACAGSESHAEVRQAIVPGARHTHLFGTIFGRELGDGVKIFCCELGTEKFRLGHARSLTFDATLQPDFVDALLLPVCEKTDAVGGGFDGVEMILRLAQGEIFVDVLAHEEGRLKVESHFCDDAESAEPDHGSEKRVAVFPTGKIHDVARRGYQFQG